jgi:hypothetical protein
LEWDLGEPGRSLPIAPGGWAGGGLGDGSRPRGLERGETGFEVRVAIPGKASDAVGAAAAAGAGTGTGVMFEWEGVLLFEAGVLLFEIAGEGDSPERKGTPGKASAAGVAAGVEVIVGEVTLRKLMARSRRFRTPSPLGFEASSLAGGDTWLLLGGTTGTAESACSSGAAAVCRGTPGKASAGAGGDGCCASFTLRRETTRSRRFSSPSPESAVCLGGGEDGSTVGVDACFAAGDTAGDSAAAALAVGTS